MSTDDSYLKAMGVRLLIQSQNEFRLFGIKICSFVEQYKVLSTDEDSEDIRDDIYLHELITEPPEFK